MKATRSGMAVVKRPTRGTVTDVIMVTDTIMGTRGIIMR